MYLYILGLALLIGGYVTFSKSLGPLDNTSTLRTIGLIGGFATIFFFGIGFFWFEWWVPFAGFFASLVLWMLINTIAFSAANSNLLLAMRSQLGILIGSILCIIALFGDA